MVNLSCFAEHWNELASTMPRRLAALESIVQQQSLLLNYLQNALDDLEASNSKKDIIIEQHGAAVAELKATVKHLQKAGGMCLIFSLKVVQEMCS